MRRGKSRVDSIPEVLVVFHTVALALSQELMWSISKPTSIEINLRPAAARLSVDVQPNINKCLGQLIAENH